MTVVRLFGPWDASIPGGLQPGQVATSDWSVDPSPDNFTYQVTAHCQDVTPVYPGNILKVTETSLEWRVHNEGEPTGPVKTAIIHVAIQNVGSHPAQKYYVIITTISDQ
jgi:hypothetical protein